MKRATKGERGDRRAVFAALLLLASPTDLAQLDEARLWVRFATIAELHGWLAAAGLDSQPELLIGEHTGEDADGRPYRVLYAHPTWHGWEIYADAREDVMPRDLDADVRAGLEDVAGGAGMSATPPATAGDLFRRDKTT